MASCLRNAAIVFFISLCLAGPACAAERDVTLQWDKSIDDPYLLSYKVYYYTSSGNAESLNPANYAVSYTLAGGAPVALSAGDPKPITIDKENTRITLRFPDNSRDYYFAVTAVDTRGIEGVPTPEIVCMTLMVLKEGTGAGTVIASPSPIHCGSSTCTANLMGAATVTLTASPDAGHAFTGWSGGGCSGTAPCVVNVTSSVTVTATFLPLLDLAKSGTGAGTVAGTPTGIGSEISCGAACSSDSAAFGLGTAVTLTASPEAGNVFAGWSGSGCPSTGQCVVTMSGPRSVTASFLPLRRLSLLKAGTGRGNVTGSPTGVGSAINCGTGCASDSADFADGTEVTLTAIPDSGNSFAGWSGGGCSGTTACVLAMDAVKSVTATFTPSRTLSVTKAGTGTGTVTGTPAGISAEINCGTGCTSNSADYSTNTVVTLTAAADAGHSFSGWSGGVCSGAAPCVVTMSAARSVTATFMREPHTITATAGANGTISPAGATTVNHGASQIFTIAANPGYDIVDVTVDGLSVGAPASYNFTAVTANHTIAATFADLTRPAGSVSFTGGAYTSAGTVTLTLSATDAAGVAAMMFSWNGGASWSPEEPYSTTKSWNLGVSDGLKTVYVKFKDGAGNWSDPYHLDLTLDTAAPALTVGSYGPCTNNPALTISGAASDTLSGLKSVTVNGATAAVENGDFSQVLTLANGDNTILIAVEDNAGNVTTANRLVTLDRTPPALTVSAPEEQGDIDLATGSAIIDIQGTVDEGAVTIEVNGGGPETIPVSGNAFTCPVTLADGLNTITVTAVDCAGNLSAVTRTVIYDKETPVLSVTEPAGDTSTSQQSMTIRGSVSDLTGITLTIDVEGTLHPVAVDNGSFAQVITFADQKSYRIEVIASDEAGHASTIIRNIVYDQTKPALVIHPVISPTNQGSQTLAGGKEATATITVTCPTATVGVVAYPTPTTWSVLLTGLSPGVNTITVTATDEAANESTLPVAIIVDADAPVTNVAINGGASHSNSASVTLSLTASADVERVQFRNETGAWSDQETYSAVKSWTLSAGDGNKTVSVIVWDAAGNWSASSNATIALDTAAPVTTASPAGGFIGKGEAIALVSSEPAAIYYTTDGSTPQTGSAVYTGPIPLSADATVKFIARDLAGNMEETVHSATYRIVQPGDLNLSSDVDIADAILAVQLLSGMTPAGTVSKHADADGDGKIGLPEVIYILQKAAGLR